MKNVWGELCNRTASSSSSRFDIGRGYTLTGPKPFAQETSTSPETPKSKFWKSALPFLLTALLAIPSAFAQETTAGIQGSVKDPSGAVVANAAVEVSSPS